MTNKQKYRETTIKRLCQYLYRYKWQLFLAILLSVAGNLLALAGPLLSGFAIDAIGIQRGGVGFSRVFYYCGWMSVCYILSSVLSYFLSVLLIEVSKKVTCQMRKDIFDRLLQLPAGFFDTHQTGDIISRISYDIDTINTTLSTDIVQVFTSGITVLVSLTMMLLISPAMTGVFLFTIPASLIFTRYRSRKVRPLYRERSRQLGELNGLAEEIISAHNTVKAYHQEEYLRERFRMKNEAALEAYYRADYYGSTIGPSVNFINNVSLSLISIVGALLYLLGRITLGSLSSFVLYSRKFSGPINEMANIISELQSAAAAAERVFRLMDEEPERDDAEAADIHDVRGEVELSNVSFAYSPDKQILHNISFKVQAGQQVAIVGPTGGGKTTLINLLMGFYHCDEGEILLDGRDIRTISKKSLRQSFGMVLQDTWLFGGTIFENIAYGKEGVTREDVVRAAKAARIHDYVMRLPQGYDTILNEDGVNISQGQKQLLTIARAMLLDRRMLILDEATSNVDTQTELKIQVAMKSLLEGKTSFVIAHRLSTVRNADIILVMGQGRIEERGTHQELMEKKGSYYRLYTAQFD